MLVLEKIPFFILSLVFSIIAILSQKLGGAMSDTTSFPFSVRLMNAVFAYVEYIYKTFWPTHLAVIYPHQSDICILSLIISGLVLLAFTISVIFCHKKIPALFVGWFWFLITLLPVIGLIQVGTQAMADRYTYFPLIGLFIGIVWSIHHMIIQFQIGARIISMATAAIILTFSMMTFYQVSIWKNSETLFAHALSVTRNNWVAHLNYGEALFDAGKVDDAIGQYKKALAINPHFEIAYLNLGTAFTTKGQTDTAITYYQKALAIKQNLPTA